MKRRLEQVEDDRDLMDVVLPVSHKPVTKEVKSTLPPGYRDRAAERRNAEEADGTAASVPGAKKGLDLGLLELQRKGVKVVDVLQADTAGGRTKLIEKAIAELFPAKSEAGTLVGWQLDLSFDRVSRPRPIYDKGEQPVSQKQSSTQHHGQLLSESEVRLVLDSCIQRKTSVAEERTQSAKQDDSVVETNYEVTYAREVQEISDDEDDATPAHKPAESTLKSKPQQDLEDDDFDMFGGVVLQASQQLARPTKQLVIGDIEPLSTENLRAILLKIEAALQIQSQNQ